VITGIQFAGLSAELLQRVRDRLPVHEGDVYSADTVQKLRAQLSEVDEHLYFGVRARQAASGRGEITLTISVNGAPPPPPPPPPPPAPPTTESTSPRLRVGGNLQSANLITKIPPVYPALAKQARVQGTVSLTVVIGKDGAVLSVDVISGHPLLAEAAVDAVKQWVYKPTLLNGQPVEVATQVDVNFTLAQ
jgi:TonB family protein